MTKRTLRAVVGVSIAFAILGSIGLDKLGMPSEEILPHLFAHPRVAVMTSEGLTLAPPWDQKDGKERSGIIATTVWPTLSVVTPPHSWPLLTESWQAAYFSYVALILKPLFGGGIIGLRRTGVLLGAIGILLIAFLSSRLDPRRSALPIIVAIALATSPGYLFIHRLAYLIESAPPIALVAAVFFALSRRPGSLTIAGAIAGLSLVLKASLCFSVIGVFAWMAVSRIVPRRSIKEWITGVLAGTAMIAPILIFYHQYSIPQSIAARLELLHSPFAAVARIPAMAETILTYLGNASAIIAPLLSGGSMLKFSPAWTLVPLIVTIFSVVRVVKRPDDREPELLWICMFTSVTTLSSLLYGRADQFQSAFMLAPFYAVVLGRMFLLTWDQLRMASNIYKPLISLFSALAIGVTGWSLTSFIKAHFHVRNSMFSMAAQKSVADDLLRRGVHQPLTTTYNAVGVYEFLSSGAIQPIHLYKLFFRPNTGEPFTQFVEQNWEQVLLRYNGPVLLNVGHNVFESDNYDIDIVRRSFFDACKKLDIKTTLARQYFSEDGTPIFELYDRD